MPGPDGLDIPRTRPLAAPLLVALAAVALVVAGVAAYLVLANDRTVSTPSLLGLTVADASRAAEAVGLGVVVVEGRVDDASAVVVSQDPRPNQETRRGTAIRLAIAAPPAPVSVPDTVGLTPDEARAVLEVVGLRLGAVRSDASSTGHAGIVTRQAPTAGDDLLEGGSVDIWVTPEATAVVPDLTGLTRSEAEDAAGQAGVTVDFLGEVTDEVLPGIVFKQSPKPGGRVSPGTRVVAVVNGGTGADNGDGDEANVVPPPSFFRALAGSYPFPVLYPTVVPAGMAPSASPDNPAHRTRPGGGRGFVVTYDDPGRPGVTFSLMEGDWFDPSLDRPTSVDVAGVTGNLASDGTTVVLVWTVSGTPYAVSATGLSEAEVVSLAAGLRPVAR